MSPASVIGGAVVHEDAAATGRALLTVPEPITGPDLAEGVPSPPGAASASPSEVAGRLALIVQSSHDAIIGETLDGLVTCWNAGAERLYGYTAEEMIGKPAKLLFPSSRRDEEAELLRRILTGGRVEQYQTERVRKDGTTTTVSISISPIVATAGGIVGIATVSRDLTDRQRVEAILAGLIEAAPDALVGVDATGRIVLVNAQTERLFGYRGAELVGQQVEILVPNAARTSHIGHRGAYLSKPRPRPMGVGTELAGRRKDGSEFPAELSLNALETSDGVVVMVAVRDVTERKRVAQELSEKNVELERAIRAKDSFLANMSHELRTPLNAIIGFTGTLLMRLPGPLNAEQEHQLSLVQSSGKHLLSIINDLLDLAKIESGRVQITLEPVDCTVVAREVVESLGPLAAGKGLALTLDLPTEAVTACADRRALGQILINLVNNAIKFTDSGGVRVWVTGGGSNQVRIMVADTGCGISEQDQSILFVAFERGEAAARRRIEGTGLGLHIASRLSQLIGASLDVSSSEGRGSTFTIALEA